jgi:hypothetical protein
MLTLHQLCDLTIGGDPVIAEREEDSLSSIGSGNSGIGMTQEEMEAIRLQVDSRVAQELHKPAMRSVLQQIQLRRRTYVRPLASPLCGTA